MIKEKVLFETGSADAEIDRLVYDLNGLTKEVISIVEVEANSVGQHE